MGAIPTEYVYYYYDAQRYVDGVRRAGTSRGEDVLGLNSELLTAIGKAFADGDVHAAWSAYASLIGVRHDTYMKTDTQGASGQAEARAARAAAGAVPIEAEELGGYEGLALRVIDGLSGRRAGDVIVNMRNGGCAGLPRRQTTSSRSPRGSTPTGSPSCPPLTCRGRAGRWCWP